MNRSNTHLAALFLALAVGCGASDPSNPQQDLPEAEGLDPSDQGQVGGKADGSSASWPSHANLPKDCDLEAPVQVFFTPDDPATTLELALIDQVRAARVASGASYEEGSNPYRIRYAVYNMTHTDIARRPVAAEKDGVDVQVLVEGDQLRNEWVEVDEIFEQGGLEVARDDSEVDGARSRSVDLIGIVEPGLMHLKTRIFETPESKAVLTGSHNPNSSAGINEENLNLIRDPALIARYEHGYEAVLNRQPLRNEWDDASPLNVMFSPVGDGPRASTKMLQWLDAEKEQILLMVFSLRNVRSPDFRDDLVTVLRRKVQEGVPVAVITDRKQSDGVDMEGNRVYSDDWTEDKLREAGIPVYEAINDAEAYFGYRNPYAAMHHKVAILGRSKIRVITDASNWTAAALGSNKYPEKNVETMLFIDSSRLDDNAIGLRYMAQWVRVLDRYAHQSAERDGEAPASEVRAWLFERPGWPEQRIVFEAEATTSYGESIVVAGDQDVLGRWGALHPGVRLSTSADTYPFWVSEAISLPLGSELVWKLTAQTNHKTRWESGKNRVDRAMMRVCAPPGTQARLEARWR